MLCAERVRSRNRALFVNCSDGADLFQVLPIPLMASFAPSGPIALAFTEEFLPTEYPRFYRPAHSPAPARRRSDLREVDEQGRVIAQRAAPAAARRGPPHVGGLLQVREQGGVDEGLVDAEAVSAIW